jgi:hypothetical protein
VKDVPSHDKLADNAKQELMNKLLRTVALFFDERSMISQLALGDAETNIQENAHNGGKKN